MTDEESETKFDQLVSTTDVNLEANLLTRVPSLKNMCKLEALWLESNKITRIAPGNVTRSLLNVCSVCARIVCFLTRWINAGCSSHHRGFRGGNGASDAHSSGQPDRFGCG